MSIARLRAIGGALALTLIVPAAASAQPEQNPFASLFGRAPEREGREFTAVQFRSATGAQWAQTLESNFDESTMVPEGIAAGADASLDDVKNDRRSNIRAAAAVLRSYADDLEIDRDDLGAWAPAIASMSDIAVEDALINYIHHDVYGPIQGGIAVLDLAGATVAELKAEAHVVPDFTAPVDPTLAPGPDYAGSIWRASPNYSARPAGESGTQCRTPNT